MLHEVCGASVAGQELAALKSPLVDTPKMFNGAFPLLIRVTVSAELVATFCAAKLKAGVSTATALVPVPVKATLLGEDVLLLVIVRAPMAAPITNGLNVMLKEQFAPAPRLAGHVLLCANAPEMLMLLICSGRFPEFVNVTT